MVIRFLCPYGHQLVVPDHRAGKKGRCPTCQQKVAIPEPEPPGGLGDDGRPLLADRVSLDPQPNAPLGFDDQMTFEQACRPPENPIGPPPEAPDELS